MKKLLLITVLLVSMIGAVACDKQADDMKSNGSDIKNQVVLYYFHTDRRCKTCKKIEETASDLVNNYFADAVKSGKLSFKQLNIDRQENLAMSIEYEAAGSKLCIADYDNDGKKIITDLTDFAFTNAFSEEKFKPGIKAAIEKVLSMK